MEDSEHYSINLLGCLMGGIIGAFVGLVLSFTAGTPTLSKAAVWGLMGFGITTAILIAVVSLINHKKSQRADG